MKAEDITESGTYKVKIGKRLAIVTVQKVTVKTEGEGKPRTVYTYQVVEQGAGKVHILRSPSYFIEEIVRKPVKGDLVRIAIGVHSGSLDAKTIYNVKSVGPKNAVILSGGKECRVPLSDLRVVEPDKKVKTEDKKGSDPTTTGKGTVKSAATSSSMGTSLRAPRTSAPTASGRDAKRPTPAPVAADMLAHLKTLGPPKKVERMTAEMMTEKSFEWCEAAIAAGYDSDNLPPIGWEPPENRPVDVKVIGGESLRIFAKDQIEAENIAVSDGHDVRRSGAKGRDEEITHSTLPSPQRKGLAARLASQKESTDDAPHLIVEARAGTGKTTTLVEGLRIVLGQESKLIPSPQQKAVWEAMALSKGKVKSICFVAFNKSIATELQERVPQGVAAMTMHSMGFAAVRNAFGHNLKVESYRIGNILSELLEEDIRDLRKRKSDVMKAVEDLVGLCKMNLVGYSIEKNYPGDKIAGAIWEEQLDEIASHYEIEMTESIRGEVYSLVPRVLDRCRDVRADMEIDFNDMVWLPVALDLKVPKYDLLLVDEAQDLNRCQQALAKKAGHRLILCGDPKQAIYGFAGADSESMVRMWQELNVTIIPDGDATLAGAKAQTMSRCMKLPLTVTRRCGKAIVEEAKKLVPDFEAFDTNGPGKVSRMKYPDAKTGKVLTEEEKKLNPDYSSSVLDGDFILCRCNAPLVSQCFRFLRQGRKATIQGRDIGQGLIKLVNGFRATDVPDLVRKLSDWYHSEEKKENAKRNPSEAKLIALGDKHDCLIAFTENMKTVSEVVAKIESVFVDNKDVAGIKLSSIHRAKGLEAKRVFFLIPKSAPCPHYMAKSAWQIEQEWNLKYVAITRAIEELVYVS